jgi:hypothetical protein
MMATRSASAELYYRASDVRAAARGKWEWVLGYFGINSALLSNRHGPCPGCGGKDRFRFDDQEGNGTFICSQGGGGNLAGDGIALLAHAKDWSWQRCVQEIGDYLRLEKRGESQSRPNEEDVAPAPKANVKKVPKVDLAKVEEFVRGVPDIDSSFLRARSPVPIEEEGDERAVCSATDFLTRLYEPDEKVLIFTTQWSQGDFLYWKKTSNAQRPTPNIELEEAETFRLSSERGVKAVRSKLPRHGKEGIWFLVQPVSGQWDINPQGARAAGDNRPTWSRRFHKVVTAWRYYVLESDDLPHELWSKVVVSLQLPIAAIYTSGSRSIHALVKEEVDSKAQWDAVRDALRQIVCPLGADVGALSAVRLSRLPFCERAGTRDKSGKYVRFAKPGLQELLYLNPNPEHKAIRLMPELRQRQRDVASSSKEEAA